MSDFNELMDRLESRGVDVFGGASDVRMMIVFVQEGSPQEDQVPSTWRGVPVKVMYTGWPAHE